MLELFIILMFLLTIIAILTSDFDFGGTLKPNETKPYDLMKWTAE